jgi:tetratricopeptide (TPR) repeat protein
MVRKLFKKITNFVTSKSILYTILKVIFYIIINLLLLYTSLKIYHFFCSELVNKTEDVFGLKNFLAVTLSIITIFFVLTSKNKIIKHFGIGIMSIIIVCLIFLIFTINKQFGSIGKYYGYNIIESSSYNKKYYLDIRYNNNRVSIEVDMEDWLPVDFVKIRIDNGLLGMPFIANYKMEENKKCENDYKEDSITFFNKHALYHLEAGHYYFNKRCFTSAIEHYTYSIIQDSLNEACYYNRGMIYTAKHDYKKALVDFYFAAFITYSKSDPNLIRSTNIDTVINNFIEKSLRNEKPDDAFLNSLYNLSLLNDMENYKTYIEYCIEKIKIKDD